MRVTGSGESFSIDFSRRQFLSNVRVNLDSYQSANTMATGKR